jgi:hypothetical protein
MSRIGTHNVSGETDCDDITEILLKVALNTISLTLYIDLPLSYMI